MMRIACPYCGERDEADFRCGGESHIIRPGPEVADEVWADYLFSRENPKGLNFERWCHVYGCGRWFNVARDTVTHEIRAVYEMGLPKPRIDGSELTN